MLDFRDAFAAIFRTQVALAVCVVALVIILATIGVFLELRIKRNRLRDALSASRTAGSRGAAGDPSTDYERTGQDVGKGGRGVK